MQDDTTNVGASSKLSRRTLAAGAAWSVPAIAVASAAPAYALSGPKPTMVFQDACKLSGGSCHIDELKWGYRFNFVVTNSSSKTIYLCAPITFTNIVGTTLTLTYYPMTPCITIAPNSSGVVPIYAGGSESSNESFTGTINVTWGHSCPCSDDHSGHSLITADFAVLSTGPQGCPC